MIKPILILADGEFPSHPVPLNFLGTASTIICCDGAAAKLIHYGITPDAIVGDMDSLDLQLQEKYKDLIHKDSNQDNNDLTKAFEYSLTLKPEKVIILGATGAREDHAIGNISLMSLFLNIADIELEMFTNTGRFIAIKTTATIHTPTGSQVSVFSLDTDIAITSRGLRYQLKNVSFDSWWKGTLNETTEESFSLSFKSGRVIVYIAY